MSFSGNSIISGISRTAAVTTNPNAALPKPVEVATSTLGAAFQINCAKHFVLVITLSIKFLENMKQGFKRRVSLNKYRSEVTIPLRNNNLIIMRLIQHLGILTNCLVFFSVLDIFFLSRNCFDSNYMPLREMI